MLLLPQPDQASRPVTGVETVGCGTSEEDGERDARESPEPCAVAFDGVNPLLMRLPNESDVVCKHILQIGLKL